MASIPLRDDPARPPFTGRTLLERALAVIHFTPVAQLGVKESDLVAAFQELIRREYPLFEEEVDTFLNVRVDESGAVHSGQEERRKWTFRDLEQNWTITLTQESLALSGERSGYTSWPAFIDRLASAVKALQKTVEPSHVRRLGVRYLNTASIADPDNDPRKMCADQLSSITGKSDCQLADLFWVFGVNEGRLLLRSGIMPPKNSYDPTFFIPREEATWYLDIDVINDDTMEFEPASIMDRLYQQASRIHAIYQWAMPVGEPG